MTDELDTRSAVNAYLNTDKTQALAQGARVGMSVALGTNPETEAELRRVAQRTGVPIDSVRAYPEEVKRQAAMQAMDFDALAKQFPSTAALLSGVENAKIAHDDVGALSTMESVLRPSATALRSIGRAVADVPSAMLGIGETGAKLVAPLFDWTAGTLLPENPLRRVAAGFEKERKSTAAIGDVIQGELPKDAGFIERGIYSGFQSFGQNLPGLASAVITRNPTPALAFAGAMQGGQSATKALDEGKSPASALAYGAADATAEVFFERFGVGALLKDLNAGSGFFKTLGHQIITEVPSEMATTLVQQFNEWAVLNPQKPFSAYLDSLPEAEGQTLLATLTQSVLTAGLGVGASRIARRKIGEAQVAQQGEQTAAQIQQINEVSAASKLRERDPATFEQFVKQASENGPVQDIFIDANTLAQSGVAEQLAQVSPSIAAQLQTALETGGDVRIPVAEYATYIAPTEYAQPLLDHLKTDPEGMTRAEAQEFLQNHAKELEAETQRVLEEKEADDTFKASADRVREQIKNELDATGRFRPDVNDAYAALTGNFFAVTAAKLGVSPEELHARYPLNIASYLEGAVADLPTLNQALPEKLDIDGVQRHATNSAGRLIAQTEEGVKNFWKWFGNSKAVDGQGRPLVAYHGTGKQYGSGGELISGDFDAFDASLSGKASKTGAPQGTFFFSNDPEVASSYTVAWRGDFSETYRDNANVVPVYLKIDSPEKVNAKGESWRDVGYKGEYRDVNDIAEDVRNKGKKDGVIVSRVVDNGVGKTSGKPATTYIVFSPEQIKSAIGNRGTFDAANPSILEQRIPQGTRGAFTPATNTISLLEHADLSTYLHELGHFFLESQFDLAAQLTGATEGERAIMRDTQALLDWFGVKDIAAWKETSPHLMRQYHEQFARGFEAYAFEGKAPSLELQGVFQRFRAWLVNIYRSLKALDVQLTDEVRGVMDRMIATTEQIKLAEQSRSMVPLFNTPEEAGMTPEAFAAYHELATEASAEAIQELQAKGLRDMQWLHNAHNREVKRLQKESAARRAEVRQAVAEEVMATPTYQAWDALTRKEGGVKLDAEAVKAMGLPEAATKRLRDFKMTAREGGLHPDMVAEQFGFSSGDEMVKALAAADKPKDAIEGLTDSRMLEQYGELSSPEALAREADKAIHNDVRARFIATEANMLAKATGGRKILASAAREFANAMVARLKVRDIRPSQYANAEARAGRNAEKAARSGDMETAAVEKRNQLINNYATRAAYNAREEVEATRRYLNKFDSPGVRKALPTEYISQIDMLLDKFDLKPRSLTEIDRTTSLRTWAQSRLNAGEIPVISERLLTPKERAAYEAQINQRDEDGNLVYPDDEERIKLLADAIERSAQRSYKDMTVEEFRGLADSIKQIEHLGRLKDKMLTAREGEAYSVIRDALANTVKANAKESGKNTRTSNTYIGKKLEALNRFGVSHIKPAIWFRIFDGGKDNGPWFSNVLRPANERANFETTRRAQATTQLMEILGPVLKDVSPLDKMGKGKYFAELGTSLNWEERFAIACNYGNESNLQRLQGGGIAGTTKALNMQQIQAVLRSLTAAEWKAVQGVWDHFETYRPEIAAKELRVNGVEPEWIAARPFTVQTADGQTLELRGGYFPVVYDPKTSLKAEQHANAQEAKDAMKAAYSAATTQRSFTKARVEEVQGRPLMLNLRGLYSGVNDVIHDLAWHEWVIDMNRLLRSQTIDEAIREHYGANVKKELTKWRDDIVAGSKKLDHGMENAVGWARRFVSASALTYNVMSAVLQPLGITQSASRIGWKWVGTGIVDYLSGPLEATRRVQEQSEFMRNRTRTMFRDLNELRNRVAGQTTARELMGRYGYFLTMHCQMMVDVPTWIGAYEKAMVEGHYQPKEGGGIDDSAAIALADQAVKDSQGGGEEIDQSGIVRGGPLVKLFTAFYDFMNTQANVLYLKNATAQNRADAYMNFALVALATPLLGALIKDALTPGDSGDWDDPNKIMKKLAAEGLSNLIGMIAFGREFTAVAKALLGEDKGQGYTGPTGLRVIPDSYKLAQQAKQGELDDGFRKAFVNVLGDLTGIPAVQINRTVTGVKAISESKTKDALETVRAPVFGFQQKH